MFRLTGQGVPRKAPLHVRVLSLISISAVGRAAHDCGHEKTGLAASNLAAVAAADRAYAQAWLSNDPEKVMATLSRSPVIVPSGMDPIVGFDSIREFWYPSGSPPTIVTSFELVQEEVDGMANLGYVRGSFTLVFDYDGKSYESEGSYFTLLRRQENGDWRIARRIWNDHRRSVRELPGSRS